MRRVVVRAASSAAFVCLTAYVMSARVRPEAGLAYTDPGSGAMIIQLLTAFGLMAAFYFSRAWHWVAKRLGIRPPDDAGALEPEDKAEATDQ